MAGIYIHIPFCRQACHYCDFHFSTNLKYQGDMVNAICKEIDARKSYVEENIDTIYFGGGTPSLLTGVQIKSILAEIKNHYSIANNAEITLEANPEDLVKGKSSELLEIGVNRLSIGVQTFHEEKLKWMNRAHSAKEAEQGYLNARREGFQNISLDLIYARPNEEAKAWLSDLKRVVNLKPDHISLYGLTIEEKTVFGKWEKDEKLLPLPEEDAASQYLEAIEFLNQSGFQQYEVSNFSKPSFQSKHNGAYWTGTPYLGIGPGAHSFSGQSRHINIRHNAKYMKLIDEDKPHFETEKLSKTQRINEQVLTSLRTIDGLDFQLLESLWGVDLMREHRKFIDDLCDQKMAELENGKLKLLPHGFLIADEISLRLFFPE
ncbi:MAG: radical SAM family heme chaperone HemW [Ekhidna sp.]